MKLNSTYRVALQAAIDASLLIMEYYSRGFHAEIKSDGSPVTEADLASSLLIHERLAVTGIPVMGEEIVNERYATRKLWERFWCVDPLDGTKEYIKRNGEFAVNIALVENRRPIFGIIASPVHQTVIFGGKETGVFHTHFQHTGDETIWTTLQASKTLNNPPVLTSSRTHYSGISLEFVNSLKTKFGSLHILQKGSSLKFFDLVLGTADVYVRFAPTMEWDIAAGQAILEGLDGEVVHSETLQPLVYNKESLLNPHFIAKTYAFMQATGNSVQE